MSRSSPSNLFAFERYVGSKAKRGHRKSCLEGMEIGEVRLIPKSAAVVYGALRHRKKMFPQENYSWDKNHRPVAVRRDEDEANDD